MAIAKGSTSKLAWKEESTFGTLATGNFNHRPINSEGLDTQIETIEGEDIREDRGTSALRGGNVAVGGNITHDFDLIRTLPWFRHLLAAGEAVANAAVTPVAYAASTAYAVGDYVLGAADGVYQCVVAGTSDAGVTQSSLDGTTVGAIEAEAGGDEWRYLGATGLTVYPHQVVPTELAGNLNLKRGDYVLADNYGLFLCVYGGETAAATTRTTLTSTTVGERKEVTAETGAALVFEYVGPVTTVIYEHTFTAGATFPAGGLSIEKQIKGSTQELFIQLLGCRLNSLDLNMTQRGLTKASWDLMGTNSSKFDTTQAGDLVSGSGSPAVGHDIYAHFDDSLIGANENKYWREGTFRLNNNMDADAYVLGDRYRIDVPEGKRTVNGSLTAYFVTRDIYNAFIGELSKQMGISIIREGAFLLFDMPEVKLTGNGAPKIQGSSLMTSQFDWTAFKDSGPYDLKITARNTTRVLAI